MAILKLSAPSVQLDCPDDWTVDMNLKSTLPCWAVLRGPMVEGFLVNIVVKVDRIDAEVSVEEVGTEMARQLLSQYPGGEVRNNRASAGRVDQVLAFDAGGVGLVQYQRFTVVEGTGGVHWLIGLEATCSQATENDLKPTFVSVFHSCQITAG